MVDDKEVVRRAIIFVGKNNILIMCKLLGGFYGNR